MDKETQVLEMAKILCPKATANCEKCSKNYKCDVKFSQLAELFDGGCQIVGEDEIVIKKSEYEELQDCDESNARLFTKNCILECSNKRLKKRLEQAKQENAREILQRFYNRAKSNKNDFADVNSYEIELIAEEFGIELE